MALRQIVYLRESLLLRSENCNQVFRQFTSQSKSLRTGRVKLSASSSLKQPRKQLVPFESHDPGYIDPNKLWKALIFTGTFTVTSFATVSIWEYEKIRSKATSVFRSATNFKWVKEKIIGKKEEMSELRRELQTAWNKLSPGEQLFIPLCALNLTVFGMWRIPRLQPLMLKYFCSNPAAKAVCWPMILSTFSHYSAFHIFANMYVLHSFSNGAIGSLGKEQFLGLYLSAGVLSSFASYLYKAVMMQPGLSLGASGAIMAILAYVCAKYPDTQLSILFLPMYTFSAGAAIKVIMGLDLAGVILGWKFFDHAAHLGGAAFGLFWCYYGSQHLWPKREYLIGHWHKLRGPISKS